MNIVETLKSMSKNEIVANKRILSVLKRAGIIFDYSRWGYLESQYVYYESECYGKSRHMTYWGCEIKEGELGSSTNPYENWDAIPKCYFGNPTYKGIKLDTKYLDGCFNAYLEIIENGNEKEVNRRMSLYGKII